VNRRIRKKRRMGEYKEFGFEMRAQLRPNLTEAERIAFLDRWLDAVESRKLGFGGSYALDGKFEGFVTRAGRGSATEDDRTALGAVLKQDPAVVSSELAALRDAWYGWK
jgi:uncharacterized protein